MVLMKKNKREVEPFRNNHVRPTEKQKQTFKHMGKAKSLQEAMLAGGYSKKTAVNPKENFVEREGTKVLLKEYTKHLENTGIIFFEDLVCFVCFILFVLNFFIYFPPFNYNILVFHIYHTYNNYCILVTCLC